VRESDRDRVSERERQRVTKREIVAERETEEGERQTKCERERE